MELRHLRYFLALAEELSFTRAAERLHVSQPPLSLQIRQLEEEIGARLFSRTSRRVELTRAGHSFLKDARAILERVDASVGRAAAIDSGLAGRLDIGLSGSHFFGPLPELITAYAQKHPEVSMLLHELSPFVQLEALRERRLDVSISRTLVNDVQLRSTHLWADPMVAVLPPSHALRQRKKLVLSDLRNDNFVALKPETSAFSQHIRDCCQQAGFTPKVVQHVSEVPAIVSLVAAGMGVALVPKSISHIYADKTSVVALKAGQMNSDVYAVQRCEDAANVTAAFIRFITVKNKELIPKAYTAVLI
jgi:DNA-binding transcriptional LysR family regulator